MCFSICNGYNSLNAYSQSSNGGKVQQFSAKEIRDAVLKANGGGKSRGVIPFKAMVLGVIPAPQSTTADIEKAMTVKVKEKTKEDKKAI